MGLLSSNSTLTSIAQAIIDLVNLTVVVLLGVALVIFFIGLIQYIVKAGDAKAHQQARESILWSLTAIFVLVSIWGLIALLNVSFGFEEATSSAGFQPSAGNSAYSNPLQSFGSAPNSVTSGSVNSTPTFLNGGYPLSPSQLSQ